MEVTRKLHVGDRVFIKPREELRASMDPFRHIREAFGLGLYLNDEMEPYAGLECEVYKVEPQGYRPERYRLRIVETGVELERWVWCPSMLDDILEPRDDQEELPTPDLDGLFDLFTPDERKETA